MNDQKDLCDATQTQPQSPNTTKSKLKFLVVIAGVCGAGKSTVGAALAQLDPKRRVFVDADDLV